MTVFNVRIDRNLPFKAEGKNSREVAENVLKNVIKPVRSMPDCYLGRTISVCTKEVEREVSRISGWWIFKREFLEEVLVEYWEVYTLMLSSVGEIVLSEPEHTLNTED